MSFRLKEAMFKVKCREPGCPFYSEFVVKENIMGATEADVDSEALRIARNLGYIKHDALYGRMHPLANPEVTKVSGSYDHLGTGTEAPTAGHVETHPAAPVRPPVTTPAAPASSPWTPAAPSMPAAKPAAPSMPAPKPVVKAPVKKAAPRKKASPKKKAAAKKKATAKKKPAARKKTAAKKKPAAKKKTAAKKRPAARRKTASKKRPVAKKRAVAKKRSAARRKPAAKKKTAARKR